MLVVCRVCASEYSIGATRSPAEARAACLTCEEDGPHAGPDRSCAGVPHRRALMAPPRLVPSRKRRQARWSAIGRRAAVFCSAPAFVLTLAVLATTTAVVARAGIVTAIPHTAVLFAAAGLPVSLGGLVLRDASSTLERQGERGLLVVQGRIANVTRGTLPVPAVSITLRGTAGETIYRWNVRPSEREVRAGESLAFSGRLAAPPAGVGDVEIALAEPGSDRPVASGAR